MKPKTLSGLNLECTSTPFACWDGQQHHFFATLKSALKAKVKGVIYKLNRKTGEWTEASGQ